MLWWVELAQVAYLNESNIGGLFSEALSADVQSIFADETGLVCANSASITHELAYILPFNDLHVFFYDLLQKWGHSDIPSASTFSVGSGSGVPDWFVRHVGGFDLRSFDVWGNRKGERSRGCRISLLGVDIANWSRNSVVVRACPSRCGKPILGHGHVHSEIVGQLRTLRIETSESTGLAVQCIWRWIILKLLWPMKYKVKLSERILWLSQWRK